jgi:hypothetical protein
LGDPSLHWRAGYSAQELAYCWHRSGRKLPPAISRTLQTAPEYVNAELVDGFFEREVELDTGRANSQTDLMLVVGIQSELAIIAVEGKVDESFDKLVREWNDSPSKQLRLEFLCSKLGLDWHCIGELRYQLLHRAYSAISEAHRYRTRHAVMMIHSFSRSHSWFHDFCQFAIAMNVPVRDRNTCSEIRLCDGVQLRLAWTSDIPVPRLGMV